MPPILTTSLVALHRMPAPLLTGEIGASTELTSGSAGTTIDVCDVQTQRTKPKGGEAMSETKQERIHRLFNELHRTLSEEAAETGNPMIEGAASTVDAAHHDYTNTTLEEIA